MYDPLRPSLNPAAENYASLSESEEYCQTLATNVSFKRGFDVVVAATLLAFILPLLVVVVASLFFAQGRPIFIRHRRVGRGGANFMCLKFRTMVRNADQVLAQYLQTNSQAREEWAATRKLRDDPRVTRLGHALRKSSVDELPQLLNVFMGDMSLVGPRPIVDDEVHRYGADIAYYYRVKPGVTGLWQVSGRNDVSYQHRVNMDVSYVKSLSFKQDLNILLKTVPAVLGKQGCY